MPESGDGRAYVRLETDDLAEEGPAQYRESPGGMLELDLPLRVNGVTLVEIRERDLDGFTARVFLHELDHLEGVVFIDRMTATSRERIESELAELKARYVARTA